ncbi:MAG TPA: FG-GAP-like repeat-containing protein, partial [Isosphaeraceae bacterium]|nr:FG-GAP-like repeat-containing protein [Isosphaeraceae bacterium]
GAADRGGLAVGDYFGNGRQDIAVAIFGNNTVAILPNNGDGTFGTPAALAMPSGFTNIRSVTTANFFGNGFADLAVAGGEGYNNVLSSTNPAGVALFENDGKGHFTFEGKYLAAVTPDPGGGNGQGDTINPEHVNAADLNNDGKPDLVLSLYDHNIDVFINNGNGTFQPAVPYTTETPGAVGGYPRGVVFGDFNGDGIVDIATLNVGQPVPADQSTPEPGSVGVLYGNGDGTFQAPIQYTPYDLPGGLAVGDFNSDGLADLAVTQNYDGHSVSVMLNQPNTANQPPTVTGVSPASGATSGGTVVTIAGTNFTGTSYVDFGSVSALSFTVNSDTSITATAPAEATGTVDVTVYNSGTSTTNAADSFTFTTVSTTQVDLSSAFNRTGIVADGTNFGGGGLDGGGNAFSSNLLGTSLTAGGTTFGFGPAGASDVVSAAGQGIALPACNDSALELLATGVNGNQANQTFTVTYTDGTTATFTQSISDWYTAQGYAGESTALSTAYRDTSGGTEQAGPFNVYEYTLPLDPTKAVSSLTLPEDGNALVLAIDVLP